MRAILPYTLTIAVVFAITPSRAEAPANNFSFFITSRSMDGGDLDGLAGADGLCTGLARAVGSRKKWHAYLSTSAQGEEKAINARDRIGTGPWYNVRGQLIARDLNELHDRADHLNKQTALTEKGEEINGVDDDPVDHDILTGSQPDGTAYPAEEDRTCRNWTSNDEGFAQVGHHDRHGGRNGELTSWNSAHKSRGCSPAKIAAAGGSGRFYCFAVTQ